MSEGLSQLLGHIDDVDDDDDDDDDDNNHLYFTSSVDTIYNISAEALFSDGDTDDKRKDK